MRNGFKDFEKRIILIQIVSNNNLENYAIFLYNAGLLARLFLSNFELCKLRNGFSDFETKMLIYLIQNVNKEEIEKKN